MGERDLTRLLACLAPVVRPVHYVVVETDADGRAAAVIVEDEAGRQHCGPASPTGRWYASWGLVETMSSYTTTIRSRYQSFAPVIRKIPIAVGQICNVMSPQVRSGKPSSEATLRMWGIRR